MDIHQYFNSSNTHHFKYIEMQNHIRAAVDFLTQLIENCIHPETVESPDRLRRCLTRLLTEKLLGHWYPYDAQRGQGYRSICLDKTTQVFDPLLTQALVMNNLRLPYANWPQEMTLWIDPDQVVYTILPQGLHPRYRVTCQIFPYAPISPSGYKKRRPRRRYSNGIVSNSKMVLGRQSRRSTNRAPGNRNQLRRTCYSQPPLVN